LFPERNRARVLWRALVVIAAAVGLIAPVTAAYAAPTVDQIDQQIAAQSAKLDQVVEQYNKVTEEMKASQAQIDQLTAELKPLTAQLNDANDRVVQIATLAYEGGALVQASSILASGDPSVLVGRMVTVTQITQYTNGQISDFAKTKAQHDAQLSRLNAVMADQATQKAGLEDQKKAINAQIGNLQALRKKYNRTVSADTGAGTPPPYVAGKAGVAINYAYAQLGKPYAWAAAGPGSFDCSGLTMAAWGAAGVGLPHNAEMQWKAMPHIGRSALQPGDLVFYESLNHVAIYVGNSQVIHAPTFGDHVRIAGIDMMKPYGYGRPRA
jgi:cell wall-associated NlpC family hydrolase